MRIFLSYPSELKSTAEPIAFSLRSRGHKVFLDRDDLPPGKTYEDQIRDGINQSDLFVCLISPEAVAPGRFTLTEIAWARQKWGTADGHVLPVLVKPTNLAEVPGYLKSVTILEPLGNVAAEVSAAVDDMVRSPPAGQLVPRLAVACAVSGLLSGLIAMFTPGSLSTTYMLDFSLFGTLIINHMKGAPFYVPLLFAGAISIGLARWSELRVQRIGKLVLLITLGWIIAVNVALKVPNMLGIDIALPDPDTAMSEDVRETFATANNRLRSIALLFGGMCAGLIGAAATVWALFGSLKGARRTVPAAVIAAVIVTGGLAGLFLVPANEMASRFQDSFLPLFVVWQAAVGAALAYAISHSKA